MNFDEIVVKESPGICRCCLSEGCYKDLGADYTWMNETEVYADMLLDCFDIGITQHNDGPNGAKRLICEVCITRLRDACNFKKQVVDSEKRFIDMLGRGEFRPKVVIYQPQGPMKVESAEETAEDVLAGDIEYLEDMDFGGDEEEIKTEALQSTSAAIVTEATPQPRPKRGRPKKEEDRSDKVKKQKISKDQASDNEEKRLDNLTMLINYTTIIPFAWNKEYACYYCDETHAEYDIFRKHALSHGLCSKRTLKRLKGYRDVMLDVSDIKCELCKTEFKNSDAVIKHLINAHSKDYHDINRTRFQEFRLTDLTCLSCDQQFDNFITLARHVQSSHLKDRFECNDCGASFATATEIAQHIMTHRVSTVVPYYELAAIKEARLTKQGPCAQSLHQCPQCDAAYKWESLLKKHINREHSDVGFQCEKCSRKMPSAMALMSHSTRCKYKRVSKNRSDDFQLPKKNPNRNVLCNQIRLNIQCVLNMSTAIPFKFKGKFCCFYCSQWFLDFDGLISHTKDNHPVCELKSKAMRTCKGEKARVKLDINGLACRICEVSLSDLNSFIDHAIVEHKADYDKSVPLKDCFEAFRIGRGSIPCPECHESYTYFATLLKHLGAEHNHYKAICAYCGRGFRSTTSLAMHISNSHTGVCECSVCNAKCNNASVLARHMARYHDAKDFKCPQCPEVFETMYKKQNHLIKAHNVGHKCAYCGKMFTRNSFMVNHVRRTHLKERTVPCSVCHVKFFDSYHMKLHMVKHEGMRRFKCELCGKSFLRAKNLKSHMDTHKTTLVLREEIQ